MTKDEYKKLNNYLNDCFMFLEEKDFFLLENMYNIGYISSNYVQMLETYDLSPKNIQYDYLTFEDVYLLAREIIESINPEYLTTYDQIIKTGSLEFNYGDKRFDSVYSSFFRWKLEEGNIHLSINITREFNYSEVCTLVHEFMHMINLNKRSTYNHHVFSEFISIYFEEYARNYLLNKGIDKEQLNFNKRINATNKSASRIEEYIIILLAYENFGSINEESYKDLNEHLNINIPKEALEEMCDKLLSKMREIETEYNKEIMYEKNFDDAELAAKICTYLGINIDYKYVIGTLLAYYQLKYSNKDIMLQYSEHINDNPISATESLKSIGINLDDINSFDFIKIIEEEVQKNNKKKVIK